MSAYVAPKGMSSKSISTPFCPSCRYHLDDLLAAEPDRLADLILAHTGAEAEDNLGHAGVAVCAQALLDLRCGACHREVRVLLARSALGRPGRHSQVDVERGL